MSSFDTSRILYSDESCIIINKKSGEAMEGAGTNQLNLPEMLSTLFPVSTNARGLPFSPTAVHRIDVPVTGCALFARTPESLAFYNTCFAEGKARKIYWAVCEIPPNMGTLAESDKLVHWISVDARHNKSYVHTDEAADRKQAILRYRIVGKGDRYLFVEVELITGRHHQIRAQLAALGLYIKGDLKYGARRSERSGGIRLHARSLAIPNFAKQEEYIQITAPVPFADALWSAFPV